MGHGRLRVYLGAAPGVGTTYRMLEEGNRRRARGADVVVGFIDTHGRPHTIDQLRGLEVFATRGVDARELDVEALLARHPGVVLVDDLVEEHPETTRYPTRWNEVTALLDAGIDVLATLDIASLESAQPVVTQITGHRSRFTIDDTLVRGADQVELVDITPEALRRRLAHGNIYQADTVDASVSNYFRAENLAELRQVAVRWISQYIEASLHTYREDLPARESEQRGRIVVGVRGSASDELLLARCAASAEYARADVIAVHVIPLARKRQITEDLSVTRRLVDECGAQFQEIADDDVATALVAFAQSERATQLVVGESRRFTGARASGVAARVVSKSRGLDVHVVSVEGTEPIRLRRRQKSHLSWRRRAIALIAAALALSGMTVVLTSLHSDAVLSMVFPVYLAAVIGLTVWGGPLIGVASSIVASFLENFYFIAPRHTFAIARADDLTALVAFLAFSIGASIVVAAFTRRSNEAERARAEAEILAKAAATVATTHDDLQPILDSLRVIFDLVRVEILTKVDDSWIPELASGTESNAQASWDLSIDSAHTLRVYGTTLDAHDRAMLTAFLGRVALGLRSQQFEREASAMRALAEADALRTSLLRAVSHDLRTPLATIEANVSTLLAQDIAWSPSDQRAFLMVIEREVHRLTRLVTNLLDAGRLEAGVVTSRTVRVEIDDLVASALETIDTLGRTLHIEIPETLPPVVTDPDLYERVIANIIANACRFSPAEQPVTIRAGVDAKYMDLLVIDRGPGVDPDMVERIKAPFQRLGDDASGAGLGLTVANGFIELLGGSIRMEDTPGGGLTVVVAIPVRAEP